MIARRKRFAFSMILLLLLAGCAHAPGGPECLDPAGGLRYCLLPAEALAGIADGLPRLVHVSGEDLDQHLVSQLSVHDGRLLLAATSLLGQPLFEIRYATDANGNARLDVHPENAPVRAAWLLAMLQIANADVEAVNGALTRAHLETRGEDRFLVQGDDTVMAVVNRANTTEITVPEAKLRIRIRTLDAGNPKP